MRSRVKACRLQLVPCIRKPRTDLSRQREVGPGQLTIDVEHAEADAFHVKGSNRPHERLALRDERRDRCRLSIRLQPSDDVLHSRLRGLTMIGSGHGSCSSSVLSRGAVVNRVNLRVNPRMNPRLNPSYEPS